MTTENRLCVIRARCEDGSFYIDKDWQLTETRTDAKRFTHLEALEYIVARPARGDACSGLYLTVSFD